MRVILVFTGAFLLGFLYSFIIKKFFESKIITLFPSIAGLLWIIYTGITFKPHESVGFDSIAIFLSGLLIILVIIGNILGFLVFKRRK